MSSGSPQSGSADPSPSEEELEYARHFLAETREELSRAEGKSAVLLAALGVVVGALLAAFMAGNWSPFELRGSTQLVWWLGAAGLVASSVCLAAAVWPRTDTGESGERRPAFFGDFAEFGTPRNLAAALRVESTTEGLERVSDQLLQVSRIVRHKYRLVRTAIVLLGLAMVLCIGSALAEELLPAPDNISSDSRADNLTEAFATTSHTLHI